MNHPQSVTDRAIDALHEEEQQAAFDTDDTRDLMEGAELGADFSAEGAAFGAADLAPAAASEALLPWPPLRLRASGLYRRHPVPGLPPLIRRGELRLDVDGRMPQMAASGVIRSGLLSVHWIAKVTKTAPRTWSGAIWFKDGAAALLPHTQVKVTVGGGLLHPSKAKAVFSGAGLPFVHLYDYVSPYFDKVEFEFDVTADANPSLAIQSHGHPNHPATLPSESLSVETIFRRTGFDVSVAGPGAPVPIGDAGADGLWSDAEMHDAMQLHWTRWANAPQWAMWVFNARLHESGSSLGGIMFDDIGPNHRQGTAVFTDAFIASPPAGDVSPIAWVARMRFWTTVHEMGHGFNLAHSWQKSLGAPYGSPWIPLVDEPEARSFMNYPYSVAGGQSAFFSDFEFRFSDGELLFMRHAPRRFVQMGNAAWFDHHGFSQAHVSPEPRFALQLRVHHDRPRLQFMEPAMIEVKATNTSGAPMVVDEDLLEGGHHLTLVVKRGNAPARLWQPFATACHEPRQRVLAPGESIYQPLFIGAGKGGWLVDEPGVYTVQGCLHLPNGEDIVSPPLQLRVEPPASHAEAVIAQDVLSEAVARVLAFDGTSALNAPADTLREASAQFADRRIATHAMVALGLPLRRPAKIVRPRGAEHDAPALQVAGAKPEEARALLSSALLQDSRAAAATLGHVEYREYAEAFATWLARAGDPKGAKKAVDEAADTLQARAVKPAVVRQMRELGEMLAVGDKSSGRGAGAASARSAEAAPGTSGRKGKGG